MCSQDEVRIEIEKSEKRMEAQIIAMGKNTKDQIDHVRDEILNKKWTDYNGVAKSFSQWGAEIRELKEHFANHAKREENDREKLNTLLEKLAQFDIDAANEIVTGYKGIISIRNLTTGIASLVIACGVIGASVVTLIKSVK